MKNHKKQYFVLFLFSRNKNHRFLLRKQFFSLVYTRELNTILLTDRQAFRGLTSR